MEVKATLTDTANASTSAIVDAKTIDEKIDKMAQKAAKTIKIDGFRPGKTPVSIIKKRYQTQLNEDAEQEILRDILTSALEKIGKKQEEMIGEPIISKFDKKDGEIDVAMDISFRPSLKIDGYKELIPKFKTPSVTKKEIDDKKNELIEMFAPIEKTTRKVLKNGDFAKFDFEGYVNGEKFEGGSAKDYTLQIGSKQFIPGFEEQMIGLKVGETKDLNVKFPQNYGAKNLAGKDAVFKVTLHEIHAKKIPETIDENMLKNMLPNEKELSVEKLEETLKSQIKNQKLSTLINDELKPKFADILVQNFKFDVPKNLIEQEIDMRFRNEWQKFSPEDMKKFREDKDALTKQRETYRDEATKSVSLTFIIDELAKAEKISVDDKELVQTIYFEAYRHGIDPKKHLESYQKQGMLPIIKMSLVEEKLFNALFATNSDEDTKNSDKKVPLKDKKSAQKSTKKTNKKEDK